MPTPKQNLVALLVLLAGSVVLHRLLRGSEDAVGAVTFEWHFWLALAVGVTVIAYAFSIRCRAAGCRRGQVLRGLSLFDVRWPGERCYYCGASLKRSEG